MKKTIAKGYIVKVKDGHIMADGESARGFYRVTAVRGKYANLGPVFGKGVYYKSVPVTALKECQDEWYASWQQSDTYRCM